jgi:NAD(P)-dependent dehydrogenase (short-subunit alcohol dehydrogenase family)
LTPQLRPASDVRGVLAGKVALVTGAGRGIGLEIADWLAAAGANVVLTSRSPIELEQGADRIAGRYGVQAIAEACDVRDRERVDALVGQIVERLGSIDIAVANAAVLGPVGTLTTVDPSRWSDALVTNVGGTMNVVRAVVPSMEAGRWGRIITLSGGGMGGPNLPERLTAYVASKAAVVAFTEAMSNELGEGVTINAVAPGAVPTTFMAEVAQVGRNTAGERLYRQVADQVPTDMKPLRDLLLYMVSDSSAWLSGCLVSARWETPDSLESLRPQIAGSSRLRLRRIDGDLFTELPKEASQ